MQTRWLSLFWALFLVAVVVSQSESETFDEYNNRMERQEPIERYGRAQKLHALNRLLKKPVFTFASFFKKDI